MGFLGEVTRLNGINIRPHDIEISAVPGLAGATPGYVLRVLRVGFEVRTTVMTEDGDEVTVVLTRTHAQAIGLEEDVRVWLTPAVGAAVVPAMAAG
jgi:sulfate transport system ATP-binding protein